MFNHSWLQVSVPRPKSTVSDRNCNSTKMPRLATISSPRRLVWGKLLNWVSHSYSLLPVKHTVQRSLLRQKYTTVKTSLRHIHTATVSSPSNTYIKKKISPHTHTLQWSLPRQTHTSRKSSPSHTHTTTVSSPSNTPIKKNLPPQTQTNNPPRPQHRRLPHGASKHGRPPPRGPLPAHRPFRRGILHRFPLLRCHRRTNILHELPVRLRQL